VSTDVSVNKREMDMSSGPLFKQIFIYAIPLMISGLLQLIYNAADVIVVGRYTGSIALAAVGSTSSLIALIVNSFLGLSVGVSVCVAQYYGAKEMESVRQVVHTAIGTSIVFGFITTIIGISMAKIFLKAMGTPQEVLAHSVLYMRIYLLGTLATMVFNFGSSILRAVGDTKRPLIFLTISGLINVILNLIFVIVFKMGVAGVATATVISQIISAVFIILSLMKFEGSCRLVLHDIKIYKNRLSEIMKIGIPAGIQSIIFSISNILVQSSVNSFGQLAMAGNTAGQNLDGLIYISLNSFYHASLAFTGQNVGAKKYNRINKVLGVCIIYVTIVGLSIGAILYFFGETLIGIYSPKDINVVKYGMIRLRITGLTYFICGIMEVIVGSLRGMGYSITPMLVSVAGICGIRILWIFTVFQLNRTLEVLYICYPVSWIVTTFIHAICYIYTKKKLIQNNTLNDLNYSINTGA
jgi:putative MATE family efflux protein